MFSINLRLRNTQKAKNGKAIVYVRLNVNGVRASDFSTNVRVNADLWDTTRQRLKIKSPDNDTLDNVVNDLKRLMNHWHDIGKDFTATEVKDHYIKKATPAPKLLQVYALYIQKVKEKEGLSKSTIQKWYNAKANLANFLEKQGKKDLRLSEVNEATATQLYYYLIDFVKNDHALRNLNNLGHVMDYAVKLKLISSNLISHDFKRSKPKAKKFLSTEQIEKLRILRVNGILKDVQKLAYLICKTGIDYSDLGQLTKVASENTTAKIVQIDRGKNEEIAFVPIIPEVRDFLEKENYDLPVIHLNVFNRHLHTFEGLLNVDFPLTTKILRKTGGNFFLRKGVPLHVVSRILGHTSVVTTQKYYADTLQSIIVESQTAFLF